MEISGQLWMMAGVMAIVAIGFGWHFLRRSRIGKCCGKGCGCFIKAPAPRRKRRVRAA